LSRKPPLENISDLLHLAQKRPPLRVVIAGADRIDELQLVQWAREKGLMSRAVLVGRAEGMEKALSQVSIDLPEEDRIHVESDQEIATELDRVVRSGRVDAVVKGSPPTHLVIKALLPMAWTPTVSVVSLFQSELFGNRPMLLTDAGITTVCNFGRLADLVKNAIHVAHCVLGLPKPRVALLSANEKQIPSLPSTWMAARLTERDWGDAEVYGPLSLDLATDPESVLAKGLDRVQGAQEVAGRADVLICPGIDTANVFYKALMALCKRGECVLTDMGTGFSIPVAMLSRSDTLETRLLGIALCAVYADSLKETLAERKTVSQSKVGTKKRILVVNPGSTSLKMAVFRGEAAVLDEEMPSILPSPCPPSDRDRILRETCEQVLKRVGQSCVDDIHAVSVRGGFLPRPPEKLRSGTYLLAESTEAGILINEEMVRGVTEDPEKEHPSNWGIPLGAYLAKALDIPCYVVDPVVVDEFSPEAELSGYDGIVRRSTAHALSVKAAAREAALHVGRSLRDISLVVAHLGGGITVAAVRRGRIVDNNIALLGGGPYTPQRTGHLPMGEVIDLSHREGRNQEELIRRLTQEGGLRSYLGEHRMERIEQRIAEGDEQARLVVNGMIYQIAKEIGSQYVAAGCDIEAIVLTGGLARSSFVVNGVRERIGRLAPVLVFPGSLEMRALALGALRALSGEETPLRYRVSH